MNVKGVDTAQKLEYRDAESISKCGLRFVGRYLVPNKLDTAWKALTELEATAIHVNGLAILLLFELDAKRSRKGKDAGEADGITAKTLAEEIGIPPSCAIYFCVDYDAPQSDYPLIEDYLYAAKQSVSPYKCGIYGKADLINSIKADYYMQCYAWSGGSLSQKTDIYQYEWQGGEEALSIKDKTGVAVDMNKCADMRSVGMWMPSKDSAQTEAEQAHAWCVENGIVDDSMRDISQFEVMLMRYNAMQNSTKTAPSF